jgi:hypothetical protein
MATRAARSPLSRIQFIMDDHRSRRAFSFRPYRSTVVIATLLCAAPALPAQENAPGPLTPPPEHEVKRVVGVPQPEAPPSLPPAQIIQGFSKKEEIYLAARAQYAYRKTIRIQEFGHGKLYEKAVSAPATSLEYLQFEPEDAQFLTRIPAFPITPGQLSKYNLQYLNTEQVDEVDCYIFQVTPKTLDRQHPLFDGVIWVDQKYLEVVKTYGKWVTDLGSLQPATLPFDMFETYRENVDGKYWFPNYSRADGIYKMKDHDVAIRVTIKWSNFKPFASLPTAPATPSLAPSAAPPATKPAPQPSAPSTRKP